MGKFMLFSWPSIKADYWEQL